MRLDTSGNLGLGVTPSAFSAGKAIEIGNTGNAIWSVNSTQYNILHNAYFSGNYLYATSNPASYYQQASGQHAWYNAPSGTAGNAITFTQAMTLDNNGILAIGRTPTTNTAGYRLQVGSASDSQTFISIINSSTGTALSDGLIIGNDSTGADIYQRENQPLRIHTNNTNRVQIEGGGNVLIGTTTDAGQKLQVNGSVTSTTITQTQTSATAILKQIGNSNAEGAAQKITIVRQYSVVSLGTKLIIPFTSQTNLNSTTICKVFGHGARYNSRGPLGFEITFAVGHLNLLDNLSSWNGNGNYASIAINGMSIEITFTANYTAATSDGVFVTIEYMTGTESYSIDVPNIAMN